MFIAAFPGPLRYPASQADRAIADLPSVIRKLDNGARRSTRDDSPVAAIHLRNRHRMAVDPRAQTAGAQRRPHVVDITPNGRLFLIPIGRSCKGLKIQPRLSLAPEVDCIALIEIEPPSRGFRFPPHAVVMLREFGGGAP